MGENNATAVIWRRLPYMLSPQLDIYERLPLLLHGNMAVLEVGFGTGAGVIQYADKVNWIDAIEVDRAAVNFARRCFPLANVRWLEDDITNPSVELNRYDFLVMIEVLEHVHDSDMALAMASGLSKQALVTVPNALRHRRKAEKLNEREWTPSSFAEACGKQFRNVQILNYELVPVDDYENRETPIIALCSSVS